MTERDVSSNDEEETEDSDTGPEEENAEVNEGINDAERDDSSRADEGIGVEEALELVEEGRIDEIPRQVLSRLQKLTGELNGGEGTSDEKDAGDETEEGAAPDTDLEERLATLEEDISELRERFDTADESGVQETAAELEETVEEQDDRLTQLQSEFEDHQSEFKKYRSHAERERERIRTHNLETFALRVIRVKDQVENMLELETFDEDTEERIEMLNKQLEQVLERSNVKRIDTDGEYDLDRHKVVRLEESEEHEPGEILQTEKAGYRLSDRVIRTAEVVAVDDS